MKTLPVILFLLLIVASISSFGQKIEISGTYHTTGYYSGLGLTLNADMTFTLKYQGHISLDTAAGTYELKGDTVYLKYHYNNYETIFASYKEQNKEVPIDIQLAASRVVLRPKTLVKKHSKLYVVDENTGKLKTTIRNGRTRHVLLDRTQ